MCYANVYWTTFKMCFFLQYCIVFFIISFLSSVFWFFMSSPRHCLQLLLISSAKCRFYSSGGVDNIIPFVLCRIFGCVVLPWWTDKPAPAVIFSACHKCCFCIPRRAGALWSFDWAQRGRGGQAAEGPKIHRQFTVGNGLVFSPWAHGLFHLPACTTWSRYP